MFRWSRGILKSRVVSRHSGANRASRMAAWPTLGATVVLVVALGLVWGSGLVWAGNPARSDLVRAGSFPGLAWVGSPPLVDLVRAGSPPPPPLICPPAPQMSTAPVLSPAAVNQPQTQTVSTTNGTWTGCNQPFTYLYAWYWSTAAPPNGTLHQITTVPETASSITPSSYGNYVGDYITASVAVCDTTEVCNGASSQDGSGNTGYVYLPPAPTISPTGTGQNANATVFTAAHTTWAGSPSAYHFQWQRNGTAISGATSSTYTANCSSDAGTTLSVQVDATTAKGTGGWVTSSSNPQFTPCNTVAPTVSPSGTGQSASGTLFTAAHGTWAGSPTSYTYQWLRNGTAISGANGTTYNASCSSDAGTTLTVEVKATGAYGTSGWKTSSNSGQFVPCNTAAPTISPDGTGRSVGESLSINEAWAGATSYSYAWLRDGTTISGATGSSYTTTATDVSHCISVKVTATNSYGSSSMTSSDSACVDNHLGAGSPYTYWSQPIDDRESLSVNVGNGNLVLGANDLQLAGLAGFDLNFPRTYNSLYSSVQDLAASFPASGWQAVASLHVSANGDVWYTAATGAEYAFVQNASCSGGYCPPAGLDAQLVKNANSSYTLTFDGSNEQLNFNSSGVLQSDIDANGNTIAFSWSSGQLASITDSLGHTTSFTYTAGQLTKITDPGNRTYTYTYDSNGRLSSFTDPTNSTTSYGYDNSGRLTQITDPDLNMTQIAYDASGRVYTVTRGLNSSGSCPVGATCPVTSFLYAQPGGSFCPSPSTETDVTDPNAHVTRYCYDSQLRVTATMDPLGYLTRTNYTTSAGGANCVDDKPCSTTDADGNTVAFTYQSTTPQNVTQETLTPPAGSTATVMTANFSSPANHYLPSSATDADGNSTNYTYNSAGDVLSATDPGNAAGATAETTYTYDPQGRMVTQVSPDGNVSGANPASFTTIYAYYPTGGGNGSGLLKSVTDPLGDETTYTYDSVGRKVSSVDPDGNVSGGNPAAHTTTYTYDADDRLLSTTDPLGHTTTYTYDGDGNEITVTDANGHTTTSNYNRLNELASVTQPDPDGSGPLTAPVTSYVYDAAGNRTQETDPNTNGTSYTYNADNRLIAETDALGNETTRTYDGDGNLLATVDPRGNVQGANPANFTTSNTYNDQGQVLTSTDPLGHVTTYTYDGDGNQMSVTDSDNHTTSYTYYPSGLSETVTNPDSGVTTYTYDANGNPLTRTDADEHTTTYAYDANNQLASVTTPLGNETTYSYDADGNRASMVDANGNAAGANPTAHTTNYGYDDAGQEISITYGDGTTPNVGFTYDPVGNRTSMTDGAGTVRYTYDNDNRMLSSTRGSDSFSYGYDSDGNVVTRTYPGGATTTYGYNADEELASAVSGGQTTGYSYDPDSELAQTTLPNGYVETDTYDSADRLTEVDNAKGGSVLSDFAYTLDPVGNPTKIVQTGAVSATTLYQYDKDNRVTDACYQATACNEGQGSSDPYIHYTYDDVGNILTDARPSGSTSYTYNADNELTEAGSVGYSYDHNGNETQAGSRTFTYDLANRLVATSSGGTTTSYTYDGAGNRLSSTTNGATTNYLWDTNNPLPQLALEQNSSGSTLRSYVYGVNRISMAAGGSAYYYLYDGIGSVVNLTSSSGASEWTYSYEPYGAIRTETQNDPNAPSNPMQFTGEYLDSQTGLYDLRARQYDAASDRFLSVDPVPLGAGDAAASAYVYAGDAPTTQLDPSGMITLGKCLGASGVVWDVVGLSGSVCLTKVLTGPKDGQIGLVFTGGGGGGGSKAFGVGASGGPYVEVSNALRIKDLGGAFDFIEASANWGPGVMGVAFTNIPMGGSIYGGGAGLAFGAEAGVIVGASDSLAIPEGGFTGWFLNQFWNAPNVDVYAALRWASAKLRKWFGIQV